MRPIRNYRKSEDGVVVEYCGIAADEIERLSSLKKRNPSAVSLLEKYHITESEAKEICRNNGLLSPIYEFSNRNGCWFCPFQTLRQFRELYQNHKDLWDMYEALALEENKCSEKINRKYTMEQLKAKILNVSIR